MLTIPKFQLYSFLLCHLDIWFTMSSVESFGKYSIECHTFLNINIVLNVIIFCTVVNAINLTTISVFV